MKVSRLQGNGMILSPSETFYSLNVKEGVLVKVVQGQINNSHTDTLFKAGTQSGLVLLKTEKITDSIIVILYL